MIRDVKGERRSRSVDLGDMANGKRMWRASEVLLLGLKNILVSYNYRPLAPVLSPLASRL